MPYLSEGFQLAVCNQNMAAASGAIFTVNGIIKVRNIVGNVTTVIGTATSLNLLANATVICASTTITTITTLTLLLRESATNVALTKIVTNAGSLHAAPTDMILGSAGSTTTINATIDASGTGVIQWALEYFPLSAGVKVTAAQ